MQSTFECIALENFIFHFKKIFFVNFALTLFLFTVFRTHFS